MQSRRASAAFSRKGKQHMIGFCPFQFFTMIMVIIFVIIVIIIGHHCFYNIMFDSNWITIRSNFVWYLKTKILSCNFHSYQHNFQQDMSVDKEIWKCPKRVFRSPLVASDQIKMDHHSCSTISTNHIRKNQFGLLKIWDSIDLDVKRYCWWWGQMYG